ncbi:MAG: hypothetical protein HY323_13355 [Betaproteobacteria bacterium]|nr:hypothetical protein [Betaproteobacteria bacterium]
MGARKGEKGKISYPAAFFGVILAVAARLVLHYFAAMKVAVSATIEDIGASVSRSIFKAFATVGQHVILAACLLGT